MDKRLEDNNRNEELSSARFAIKNELKIQTLMIVPKKVCSEVKRKHLHN